MRRCDRCETWKPDANFALRGKYGRDFHPECTQCRSGGFDRLKNTTFVGGPDPIPMTARDARRVLTARAERAKFLSRGAPTIKRPYVRFLTGELVPKEAGRGRDGAGV